MGGAPDSIPSRLQRGEPADVMILAGVASPSKAPVAARRLIDFLRSPAVRQVLEKTGREPGTVRICSSWRRP
jgi:hypothetical protein